MINNTIIENLRIDVFARENLQSLFCAQENVLIFLDLELVYSQHLNDREVAFGADEKGDLLLTFDSSSTYKIIYLFSSAQTFNVSYEVIGKDVPTIYQFVLQAENKTQLHCHIDIKKEATLHLYQFLMYKKTNAFSLYNKISLAKSSNLFLHNMFALFGDFDYTLQTKLQAENANVKLQSVNINHQDSKHSLAFIAEHNVGETTSEFKAYHIAKNGSQTYVKTNGVIKKGAKKSSAQHNTKGIIIDKKSYIQADPLLEIEEYDVVAGHGASIGDLDEAEIFYLMSRGLSKADSERMIIGGLVSPVLSQIKDEYSIEFIEQKLMKLL